MRFCLCLLLTVVFSNVHSQQFGAFPPSIRWKQIDSDTARVTFEPQVRQHAERVTAIINRMARENPNPLGNRIRKINTILQSNTTLANGYVALAPFRSEYYLVHSSDIFAMGANPWQDELAIHEYRHVMQNSNFNVGVSRVASFILGEEGQALFNSMAIPDWFYEGDAVHAESALSPQGRGKIPYFFNGFNALFRHRMDYSWMKLRNGSLKDYVPNHYQLGYLLVNYGYLKYGTNFWGNVTQDAAAFKSPIYPFQSAIGKYSGKSFKQFRSEALEYYRHQVSHKRTDTLIEGTVTHYHFPQFISADSIIYLKGSYKQIPSFYIRNNNGEQRITLQNITSEEWFSYRNGKIIYTSYDVHPRWNLKDYSNIILYDIHSGEEKRITRRSKYFNPDISPSGNKIISVFVNDSANAELHLLSSNGELRRSWYGHDLSFYLHPKFIDENRIVAIERHNNSTMSMFILDVVTGERQNLISRTSAVIGYPSVVGNKIYFNSSLFGNDDIYMMDLSGKNIQQVTSGVTGFYYPHAFNDQLVWSKFTTTGLQLQTGTVQPITSKVIKPEDWKTPVVPYTVAGDDSLPNLLQTPPKSFPASEYKQGKHLFNFHSWRPFFSDPEYTFSLYSDNVLSNFTNELYYRYNQNETSHAVGFSSFYGGFFPVLNAGVSYTTDRTIRTRTRTFTLNEFEARAGYYIPLNLTQGNTYKSFSVGQNIVYNQPRVTGLYKDSLQLRNRIYLHHFLNWSQRLPRAIQQIYPKWGYAASAHLRHFLTGGGGFQQSAQWLINTQAYLPSFGNHSIVATASLQDVDTISAAFSNRFVNARGYSDVYFRRMWRASGNYHFPIVYPDFGFANLVYFLRVRGNVFFDYSKVYAGFFGSPPSKSWNLRSVGGEIYFDSKWWNQLPVSFGFRVSHLLDLDFNGRKAGTNVFEFIVPVDLIPR